MGCVEEGRRVDGEGVGVVTRAVARAKVRHVTSRSFAQRDRASGRGATFFVFLRVWEEKVVRTKSQLLRP